MELSINDINRFWSKVDIQSENECWLWTKKLDKDGYGYFWVGGRNGRHHRAHRIAWQIRNKREPQEGYEIAHAPIICHNRACVNPNHLREDTRIGNSADMRLDNTILRGDKSPNRLHPERMARGDRHGSRTHPNSLPRGKKHWHYLHPELTPRGEKNGAAKLTWDEVRQIRELCCNGLTHREIASMFGVGKSTVGDIKRGKNWVKE